MRVPSDERALKTTSVVIAVTALLGAIGIAIFATRRPRGDRPETAAAPAAEAEPPKPPCRAPQLAGRRLQEGEELWRVDQGDYWLHGRPVNTIFREFCGNDASKATSLAPQAPRFQVPPDATNCVPGPTEAGRRRCRPKDSVVATAPPDPILPRDQAAEKDCRAWLAKTRQKLGETFKEAECNFVRRPSSTEGAEPPRDRRKFDPRCPRSYVGKVQCYTRD